MEPVYGMHLGLVVSDTPDPEGRNRIQVWIPYLSSTIYNAINSKIKNIESLENDFTFKGPGDLKSIDSTLLDTLKKILPWAEYAAPLFGGSGGLYNGSTGATATNSGSTLQEDSNPPPKGSINFPMDLNSQGVRPTQVSGKTISKIAVDDDVKLGNSKYTQDNVLGIVVNDPSLYGTKFPLLKPNGDPYLAVKTIKSKDGTILVEQNKPILVTGVDYNPAGIGNTNSSTAELTLKTVEALGLKYTPSGEINFAGGYTGGSVNQIPLVVGNVSEIESIDKNPVQIPNMTGGSGFVAGNAGSAGSAVGSFTTPNAGSKVWVFFLGGDVQRPIYFAQAPNPGDIAAS